MFRLALLLKLIFVSFILINCVILFTGCGEKYFTEEDFKLIKKIDVHVHIRTFDSTFVKQAKEHNFELLTICTRSSSQEYIDKQFKFALFQKESFPEQVAFATTFSMEDWGKPGWQKRVIERLNQDFNKGAIAVKVWKDIGMTFRDNDGNFIMIDDPSFDPIFDFIASQRKTVVAHIGEPKNCWLPLEEMTVNNDRNYFKTHPQYHMYLHPDYPSYEDQINARDRMLGKHPDLKVIGAHVGSLEWDVDEVATRLEKFPNLTVEMAARVGHLQYQAIRNWQKVRDFLVKYQDRVLYGTDLGTDGSQEPEKLKQRMHDRWLSDWKFLTTDQIMTHRDVNGEFRGLKLPRKVVEKIYLQNAEKGLPGI